MMPPPTSSAVRYIPEENEKDCLFDDANEFCRMAWTGQYLRVVFEEVHQIAKRHPFVYVATAPPTGFARERPRQTMVTYPGMRLKKSKARL